MKLYVGLAAAATATAIIGAALAAESDKFVVRGDATKVTMEQNSINIATAEAIAKACVDEATKEGVKVSIVIYDQFGEPVYFTRMDGQGKANVDTAFMKARTALNVRAPSKTVMNQVLQGRASELRQYSFGNFANSGGLPIIINGKFSAAARTARVAAPADAATAHRTNSLGQSRKRGLAATRGPFLVSFGGSMPFLAQDASQHRQIR